MLCMYVHMLLITGCWFLVLLNTQWKMWWYISMFSQYISYILIFFFFLFFSFIIFFISWRLLTLQYCSGFCHTLTWISHGYTCIPHPNHPSHFQIINQNDIICGVNDWLQSIYHTLAYIRKQSLNFNNLYVITQSYLTLLWNEIP